MRKFYPWLGLLALAGCKQTPELSSVVSPYKMDIQQGNVVTPEALAKLKAGMTRAQVRFALGSPLVVDPFRTDRWDYVYSLDKQGKSVERRRVTVIFDEDKLLRLDGDILPVDPSLISDRPVPPPRAPVAATPAAAPEKPAAPKPEAARPAEKPAVKAPVAAQPATKPEAAPKTAVAKPVEKPVAQAPAVKPEAVVADKPSAPAAAPAKAAAQAKVEAPSDTSATDSVTAEAPKADTKSAPAETKKIDTAKVDMSRDKPKQGGFFGRMLDKIGF